MKVYAQLTLEALREICAEVRLVFPNAVIGGGAPRDVFLGATVKDIDVFVQCSPTSFGEMCSELATDLCGTIVSNQAYVHAPSYDIAVPGLAQPLNVVWRDCNPIMDIGDYDFGISQIGVTDTEIYKTGAFMQDVANNTVTYMHAKADKPEWHVKSSRDRLVRILAKHPSLSPVNAEKLTAYGVFVPAWN